MIVWGLTGNIACGKSTVEALLREAGIAVVDMDAVAREVVEPGTPALQEIRSAFGDGVLDGRGRLDRCALGSLVFADAGARSRLEGITWPRILARTTDLLRALEAEGRAAAVVSAAMLVESGMAAGFDGLAVVTCPPEVQLARLLDRDGPDRERALARIGSQAPQDRYVASADVVIDNGGTVENTRLAVGGLVLRMLGREATRHR